MMDFSSRANFCPFLDLGICVPTYDRQAWLEIEFLVIGMPFRKDAELEIRSANRCSFHMSKIFTSMEYVLIPIIFTLGLLLCPAFVLKVL